MKWKKGESGNLRGRPPGTGSVARLRAGLAEHLNEVIAAVVAAAKNGDTGAAKLILERTIPALRPEELPVNLQLSGFTGSRAEIISAVVRAIVGGEIDVSRGVHLIAALTQEALEERIEELERIVQGGKS